MQVVQVCDLPGNYNLLGFGDVLVPGLLLSFLRYYDLKTTGRRLYFPVSILGE